MKADIVMYIRMLRAINKQYAGRLTSMKYVASHGERIYGHTALPQHTDSVCWSKCCSDKSDKTTTTDDNCCGERRFCSRVSGSPMNPFAADRSSGCSPCSGLPEKSANRLFCRWVVTTGYDANLCDTRTLHLTSEDVRRRNDVWGFWFLKGNPYNRRKARHNNASSYCKKHTAEEQDCCGGEGTRERQLVRKTERRTNKPWSLC